MFKHFVISFLVFATLALFYMNIGKVEGYLFPVNSQAVLFSPEGMPPPNHRFKWKAIGVKYRDCDFVKIVWYLGPRNGRKVEVFAEFLDKPKIRGLGVMEWESLVISLDPFEVVENSHADVYHNCGAFWLVKSEYYG